MLIASWQYMMITRLRDDLEVAQGLFIFCRFYSSLLTIGYLLHFLQVPFIYNRHLSVWILFLVCWGRIRDFLNAEERGGKRKGAQRLFLRCCYGDESWGGITFNWVTYLIQNLFSSVLILIYKFNFSIKNIFLYKTEDSQMQFMGLKLYIGTDSGRFKHCNFLIY